jgi:hypothetical protein
MTDRVRAPDSYIERAEWRSVSAHRFNAKPVYFYVYISLASPQPTAFLTRLWRLASFPFLFLFKGIIRL